MNRKNIFVAAQGYAAPAVERIDVAVESGFAASTDVMFGGAGQAGASFGIGDTFEF